MEADRAFRSWRARLEATYRQWADSRAMGSTHDPDLLLRGNAADHAHQQLEKRRGDLPDHLGVLHRAERLGGPPTAQQRPSEGPSPCRLPRYRLGPSPATRTQSTRSPSTATGSCSLAPAPTALVGRRLPPAPRSAPHRPHGRGPLGRLSPDGKLLASASSDKTVRPWASPTTWIEQACQLVGRNLIGSEWTQLIGTSHT